MIPQILARRPIVERREYILARCSGKTVLHLGCVDHPLLAERIATGDLLHAALRPVSTVLYGVDVDDSGLRALRELGFDQLFLADVEGIAAVSLDRQFEVIVAGEIIEHLANPGLFLTGVTRHLADGGRLIATVPSAQSIRLFANTLRGREVVHPDHNAYYSPTTFSHLLESHGFEIEEMQPYWSLPREGAGIFSLYDRVVRLARHVSPWLGEGIVVSARFVGAQP